MPVAMRRSRARAALAVVLVLGAGQQLGAMRPGTRAAASPMASARTAMPRATPAGSGRSAAREGPAAAPEWDWLAGGLPDLAPAGLPDFSQCRRGWGQAAPEPGRPAQWTYAGPVALAGALWWLDSRAEPGRAGPPTIADGHGLVTAYPVFGRARDDHDAANLPLLVEDLALRAGTDGRGGSRPERGTRWTRLNEALADYLSGRRLAERYALAAAERPDAAWLRRRQEAGGAVLLALGVWERQGEAWKRVGGHYAGLAGTGRSTSEPAAEWLALADPLADQDPATGAGRALPPDPARHSCRLAPAAHDDPAIVSHDGYALTEQLPDGRLVLQGYFGLDAQGEAAAFAGQNALELPSEQLGDWQGGAVVMALDAALAILPDAGLLPATATVAATATGTPTASPTATRTSWASATATASSTAAVSPPPLGSPAAGGRVALPWLGSGG